MLEKIHREWSRMAIRLEHHQKIYGMMAVSIPQDLTDDEEEQALFQEVAQDIALALHTIAEEALREQVETALGQSENRYKQLLESVTDYIYSVTVENGKPVKTVHRPGCEAVTG
jgi:PAS domain-containing protein